MTIQPFAYRDVLVGYTMGFAFGGRGYSVGITGGGSGNADMAWARRGSPIAVTTNWMALAFTWAPSWFFVTGKLGMFEAKYIPMRKSTYAASDVEPGEEKRTPFLGIRTGLILSMYKDKDKDTRRKFQLTARPYIEAMGPSFPLELRLAGKPLFVRDSFSSVIDVSFGLTLNGTLGEPND